MVYLKIKIMIIIIKSKEHRLWSCWHRKLLATFLKICNGERVEEKPHVDKKSIVRGQRYRVPICAHAYASFPYKIPIALPSLSQILKRSHKLFTWKSAPPHSLPSKTILPSSSLTWIPFPIPMSTSVVQTTTSST